MLVRACTGFEAALLNLISSAERRASNHAFPGGLNSVTTQRLRDRSVIPAENLRNQLHGLLTSLRVKVR